MRVRGDGRSGLGRAMALARAESGPMEMRLRDCRERTRGSEMPAKVLSRAETARAKMPVDRWAAAADEADEDDTEGELWWEPRWVVLVASEVDEERLRGGERGVGVGFKFLSNELLEFRSFVSRRDGCETAAI